MNRFRFRLETVLRLRQSREEEKKRELAAALTLLNEEEKKFRDLLHALEEIDRARTDKGKGRISARLLQQQLMFSRRLQKQCEDQKKKVSLAETAVQEKRLEVTEAMRKRKTLERLKERKRVQFEADTVYQEQIQLDETALQQFSGGHTRP